MWALSSQKDLAIQTSDRFRHALDEVVQVGSMQPRQLEPAPIDAMAIVPEELFEMVFGLGRFVLGCKVTL